MKEWRETVVSETDFAMRDAAKRLGLNPAEARGYMIASAEWKYIFWEKNPPQLFDRINDLQEQNDRAGQNHTAEADLHERLFAHFRARRTRTTISDKALGARAGRAGAVKRGMIIGEW